ncbi:MAG: D-alanyl-D-alanine carboxypeptidase [Clostridia bacterium]|nr:D-alanyl-D-alanine carboxypeptidase [Clostridia bacterium]
MLYEHNADEALPPASVTKIMTLLLIAEAVDNGVITLSDNVTASAYAASMGGSQIYLKEGEVMSVEDMVKSIVIASANDAAVAMAEHLAGSEEAFVKRMNERAVELGMTNTYFENTNGLDDTAVGHVCSARDIAIMSRELLRHTWILNYTTIWMDSVRDGQFGLTNTNRLIKSYNGANGLKTGSTDKAKFCISATAKRDEMQLIAVIMGASTRDSRNLCAARVLDYGFANFKYYCYPPSEISDIPLRGGEELSITGVYDGFDTVMLKSSADITAESFINEELTAPISKGQVIGQVKLTCDGEEMAVLDVTADRDYGKIGYMDTLELLFEKWILL